MTALALNLMNLAVTEYTTPLTGICGDFETTADGVFAVGGTADAGAVIPVSFKLGLVLSEGGRRIRPKYLYMQGEGLSGTEVTVRTSDGGQYKYRDPIIHDRTSRHVLGAGLRDNYVAVEVTNSKNTALDIDRLEFETLESQTRRL